MARSPDSEHFSRYPESTQCHGLPPASPVTVRSQDLLAQGFSVPCTPLHCPERRHLRKKKKSPLHIETTNPRAAGPWDICMGSFCLPPILPNREVFSSVPLGVFTPVVVHIMRTYPSVFPLEQGHRVLNLSQENIRTF